MSHTKTEERTDADAGIASMESSTKELLCAQKV
jgi:hypothetical protein